MSLQQLKPTTEMGRFFNGSDLGEQEQGGHYGNVEVISVKSHENQQQQQHGGRSGGRSKLCARGHWRPAEDAKLMELVSQHGPQNWNLIAQNLAGRSGKSCRLRWFNQLDPRVKKKPFTPDEDERLLAAQQAYGNKWARIVRLFPGRTDNAVKNHWHVITSRMQRRQRWRVNTSIRVPSPNPPPSFHSFSPNSNASSGKQSRITGTRDGSVSTTSADLSLISSNRVALLGFNNYSPLFQQMGFAEKVARNGGHEGAAPMRSVPGADQSAGYSDSNSDASAAESVVSHLNNNNNNGLVHGDRDHEIKEKISFPFIDFLGVGPI